MPWVTLGKKHGQRAGQVGRGDAAAGMRSRRKGLEERPVEKSGDGRRF
jgi:hypothetical protein